MILKEDVILSDDLVKEIKTRIRSGISPRHVPAYNISSLDSVCSAMKGRN